MPTGLYYYAVPPSGAGGGAAAGDATGDGVIPRSPVTLPPDGVATLEPCCDPVSYTHLTLPTILRV